jgi:carbonyl reductase 1
MVNARVAVVTGANKGIGYHIAQSLVHSGLFSVVVLGCRDSTRGQHAAAEIGGCAEFMPLEVGNAASADNFAEALVARHGRCDVLVNNAGIAFKDADPTPFAEQTKPTLDVNYRGTLALTRRLLPLLQAGDDPRIVNVASMAGKLKQLQPPLQANLALNPSPSP